MCILNFFTMSKCDYVSLLLCLYDFVFNALLCVPISYMFLWVCHILLCYVMFMHGVVQLWTQSSALTTKYDYVTWHEYGALYWHCVPSACTRSSSGFTGSRRAGSRRLMHMRASWHGRQWPTRWCPNAHRRLRIEKLAPVCTVLLVSIMHCSNVNINDPAVKNNNTASFHCKSALFHAVINKSK